MAEGKVLPYLDIPFQHASPAVLKAMRRPGNQEKTLERIRAWREICPDLAIRSTFIVGFPGETEEDFRLLLDWLRRGEARSRRLLQIRAGRRRAGQRPRPCRCRTRSRTSAGTASCERSRRSAPRSSPPRSASGCQVIVDEAGARRSPRAASKCDAPEIDGAVHVALAPAAAGGRHRHGQDRARRRLRSARRRGVIGPARLPGGAKSETARTPSSAGVWVPDSCGAGLSPHPLGLPGRSRLSLREATPPPRW